MPDNQWEVADSKAGNEWEVVPEAPTFGKGKDVSKWTAFQAKQRLSHMNPEAPEAPGAVEHGLGKLVGTETAARMKDELPAAAAMVAMAMQPELVIPKAATWGPRMYILAKAALSRVAASAVAAGATKGVLATSPTEGAKEAGTQAVYGAAGETVLGAGRVAIAGGKALVPGIVSFARGTTGGRIATKEAADAIAEHANTTIKKIVDTVSAPSQPEILGADAAKMVKTFDLAIADSQLEMAEIPKAAAREAGLKPVSIEPLIKDLESIVKADEKRGGFMAAFAALDRRASQVAGGARKAATDISQIDTAPQENETQLEAATRVAKEMQQILRLRKATLPALMNIRGTISQVLADESGPAELRLVAKRIGTQRLDGIIESNLEQIGAGGTWDAYLKNYANAESIRESALYRTTKANPQKIAEYIAPFRPDTVSTLKAMANHTNMPEIVPNVQRQFLEARLGKGIENFSEEIEGYGSKTVGSLFDDPRGKEAVSGLKDLSRVVKEKMTAIGAGPENTMDQLKMALAKGMIPAAGSGVGGAYLGYKEGGPIGAIGGGMAGAALGFIAPNQIVKLANDPVRLRKLTALIGGLRADSPPAVFNAITQTVASAVKKLGGNNAAPQR